MSTEETGRIARSVMECLDRRDLDGMYANYHPAAVFYGWAPVPLDKESSRRFMSALLEAFPDSRLIVDDWVIAGDSAVARHHLEGTHRGEFQGVPATGKTINISAIVILKVKDGKVIEGYLNADNLGLLQQLGVIPAVAG